MKREVKVRVLRGDKLVTEDATYWIDELPPTLRRGKNKKDKSRCGKRDRQERLLEEALRLKEETS